MRSRSEWSDVRAIEVEAAGWIAQLNGDRISEADRAALREWCARSQAHREALRRLSGVWAELDVLAELPGALRVERSDRDVPARLRWNRFWLAHAAALALVIVGSVIWISNLVVPGFRDSPVELYATDIGEQRTIELVDHSTIHLNTNSLVEVDYAPRERRVRLVKGEALFEVERNEGRPFVVYAAANTVRAIGTRFLVRLIRDDVEVVVSEGSVELTRPVTGRGSSEPDQQTLVLIPKQTTRIDERLADPMKIVTVDSHKLERRLAWTTGVLEFDGEPLSEVIAEVARYTPLRIEIAQAELGQMPVGGRFRVGETEALFDVIEAGFGAHVVYEEDGVLITLD